MLSESELQHNRDRKRINQQGQYISKQRELIAKLEKERDISQVVVESVGEVKAHEIYKALGTMAVLPIVKIEGAYYMELSEKRYRELVYQEQVSAE